MILVPAVVSPLLSALTHCVHSWPQSLIKTAPLPPAAAAADLHPLEVTDWGPLQREQLKKTRVKTSMLSS